jgi:hypothetical protein
MSLRYAALLLMPLLSVSAMTVGCAPQLRKSPAVVTHDASPHPADQIEAADRLPATALAFVVAHDLENLVTLLGRDELRGAFLQEWERAAFELVDEIGFNLLSPRVVADLGVDINAPAGAALLPGRRDPLLVVFFSLSEPHRFKNELYRALKGRRRHRPLVVDSTIIVGDDDGVVLINGDMAMAVFGDNARQVATRLAKLPEDAALSRHRPFRVAMRGEVVHRDLRGYADIRALMYMSAGLDRRWAGADHAAALADIERTQQESLAAARERRATTQELVAMDENFKLARAGLRDDPTASAMRSVFGDVSGAGFSLGVSTDQLHLSLDIDTAQDSFWRRLLVNQRGLAPMLTSLDGEPGFVGHVSIDPSVMALLLRKLGADEELEAETGLQLERDFEELSNGELGLAVILPDKGFAAVTNVSDLRFIALAGLRDAKAAKALLGRLAERDDVRGNVSRDEKTGDLQFRAGETRLTLAVRGSQLILASHPDDVARIAKGTPGSSPTSGALRLIKRGGTAADAMLAIGLPVLTGAHLPSSATTMAAAPPWHDPGVTKSKAYKDKLAELRAVDGELEKLLGDAQRATAKRRAESLDPLGAAAVSVRITDNGIELIADYSVDGPSMVEAWAGLVQAERELVGEGDVDEARFGALYEKRSRLEAELEELYARNLKEQRQPSIMKTLP